MIVVKCELLTIPLYWELLDNKSGNSNSDDRIDLLKKCINLLGKDRIGLFLGDREFVGHKWLSFLKREGIPFCIRFPKNHKIGRMVDGEIQDYYVESLFKVHKTVKIQHCIVDGVWGSMYAKRLKDDILFLFGTTKSEYLPQFYKKRWSIECFFSKYQKERFQFGRYTFKRP